MESQKIHVPNHQPALKNQAETDNPGFCLILWGKFQGVDVGRDERAPPSD
jgi:hypothetical protein